MACNNYIRCNHSLCDKIISSNALAWCSQFTSGFCTPDKSPLSLSVLCSKTWKWYFCQTFLVSQEKLKSVNRQFIRKLYIEFVQILIATRSNIVKCRRPTLPPGLVLWVPEGHSLTRQSGSNPPQSGSFHEWHPDFGSTQPLLVNKQRKLQVLQFYCEQGSANIWTYHEEH